MQQKYIDFFKLLKIKKAIRYRTFLKPQTQNDLS